jgi:hypothetical protein
MLIVNLRCYAISYTTGMIYFGVTFSDIADRLYYISFNCKTYGVSLNEDTSTLIR